MDMERQRTGRRLQLSSQPDRHHSRPTPFIGSCLQEKAGAQDVGADWAPQGPPGPRGASRTLRLHADLCFYCCHLTARHLPLSPGVRRAAALHSAWADTAHKSKEKAQLSRQPSTFRKLCTHIVEGTGSRHRPASIRIAKPTAHINTSHF